MTLAVSYKAAITGDILPFVSKPSRYIAAEWNSAAKDPAMAGVSVALAFPDVYEIGMSHLGLKILYQLLNDRPEVMWVVDGKLPTADVNVLADEWRSHGRHCGH